MKAKLVTICLLLGSAATAQPAQPTGAPPARAPRYIEATPYDFGDHAGWVSVFDGRTLDGWEGQASAWRVEDGAIVSSVDGASAVPPVYLFWKGRDGGELADFEFKTEIKLEGEKANSGVQFRAMLLGKTEKPNSEWESFGYQADFDFTNVQTGALIECCSGPRRGPRPRPFRAAMGSAVRTAATADGTPATIGSLGNRDGLGRDINAGGWYQLHIIARGHTLAYIINGQLMSVVIDDDPERFLARGRLAIQLEGSGARRVAYRNMWLKTYN